MIIYLNAFTDCMDNTRDEIKSDVPIGIQGRLIESGSKDVALRQVLHLSWRLNDNPISGLRLLLSTAVQEKGEVHGSFS
jgi:hypothetical protein